MPAFSPVRRSARVAARVVPFDPVAEALRPQSAHKVKKPKAFYIESVMEIRKTQYHEEFGTNNGGFCKVMMREGDGRHNDAVQHNTVRAGRTMQLVVV